MTVDEKRKLVRERVRKFRFKKKIIHERRHLIHSKLNAKRSEVHTNNQCEQNQSKQLQSNPILTKLRHWAFEHKITTRAINDLLKILITCGFSWLPADYRAFSKTPRNVEINQIANGKFWYNGIKKNLCSIFTTIDRDVVASININVDGLPLFNSSKIQFWPILASIHGNFPNHLISSI